MTSLSDKVLGSYFDYRIWLTGLCSLLFSCSIQFIQSLSRVQLSMQASLFITNSRVYSNSCPSSQWCHPAISSSVVPFSSCPQPLQASGSFPMSQLFAWCGQSIGVSASASVLPMNTQDWSPSGRTGWISLQSKGLSRAVVSYSLHSIDCSTPGFPVLH